jgi:hypothetical protein
MNIEHPGQHQNNIYYFEIKGTQAWDILGLRFWILYFFVVTYT